MSSSRPFSQMRSSVKSLLRAAVVVVFNWERKCRPLSGSPAFLLGRPFQPQSFVVGSQGLGGGDQAWG